ncbi:E3 ubiquitin-protein ligase MIB2-like [Acanthaster planci]|uniref:E3 ubiquitin-protein ligase MIB2-like n=1 Tax=Acanthaster planci TaxID=133434 RepID=A0A8B7Z9R3_ACAPL|nr:E3 ubiquitin-protein ligase MIB2-like [Acanthaster planci]
MDVCSSPDLGDFLAALLLNSELEKLGDHLGTPDTSLASRLFQAAASGNSSSVREILLIHPEAVKLSNKQSQTALQVASHEGHTDVVSTLVLGGAPLEHPDDDGDTAIAFAVLGNKADTVKRLLLAGSNVNASNNKGLTPLHLAAAKGHQTCVEVLLKYEQKCDVNCQDKDGNTPLFHAVVKNNKQIIHWLVNNPRSDLRIMNKKGFNSLHHAVFLKNIFAVEAILSTSPTMINVAKNDGFTALHLAAFNDMTDITLILVKKVGCKKELKTGSGQTALHLATDKTHIRCIEALVNNGANVNAQDSKGNTSLHLLMLKASVEDILRSTPMGQLLELVERIERGGGSSDERSKFVAIAIYLVTKGADIFITNRDGKNVLDVTLNPTVKKLLKDFFVVKRIADALSPRSRCVVS